MGWLMRLTFVFSILLLAHAADTAACKSSCASSTPQQQQGGGSLHLANGGGPDYLVDYDCGECYPAEASFGTSGQGSGTGGSKASFTVPELEECKSCIHSLHRASCSIEAPSPVSKLCQLCLRASRKDVDWQTKDFVADTIATAMLKNYVGEVPVLAMPDEFPCVDCLLFMLETGPPSIEVYYSYEELEPCGMCMLDGRVAKELPTFIAYGLTSLYLNMHIYHGLPYEDDDSELAKLISIMSPEDPEWMKAFYKKFMFHKDSTIPPQDMFRSGIPNRVRQRAAAIIKRMVYPSKQRISPVVAPTTPTNKVPHAKEASKPKGAQSHGVPGSSKGKAAPAKAGPMANSAANSSVSDISGARNNTLQPACDKCDEHEEKVVRFMHKYRLLSKYFVHDARDTPIECAWPAYFGLCFAVSLLAVPALWFRYLRALDKHARKGRRPPQNLVGFVRFACADCITFIKHVLTVIKRCLQAVFTARCLAWCGFVLLLLALFHYAYIHGDRVQQHTLAACSPYVLSITALSCACISFPRIMNRILWQPMVWCLGLPVMLGRRLGDIMSQPSQQHDTLHGESVVCDLGGGRNSIIGGQHTDNKQPQPRRRSKGRKGRNRCNSTLPPNSSRSCSNGSTSRGASSNGETHTVANTTASNDNMGASNSNACGRITVVAVDTHVDKGRASMPQVGTSITDTLEVVGPTTMQHTAKGPSHMAGDNQSTASPKGGSQQDIIEDVDQLLVGRGSHAHAPTVAATSAPAAAITPAIATVAASSPPRLPPANTHIVAAHPPNAAEATTAATQSAVAPSKAQPPSQSVAVPSVCGLSHHACDDPAVGNRLHSSCNRVASSVGRVIQGHGLTAGRPQAPPSSTLKLGNKAKAGTTSTMSSTASTNASDEVGQRMVGGGSSNTRDVPATSGPDSTAVYRPLVLTRSPTSTSTTGSVPSSAPVVGVTASDLEELPLLAPKLASSGPPVPGDLSAPPVNVPAVITAPLVLPPPLQLDSLAVASTTASAVPAEAAPIAAPTVGSDASSDAGGAGLCVICWDGELTHGLMHDDCIHLCMCNGCSAKYDHDAHGCPVCRRAGELIQL